MNGEKVDEETETGAESERIFCFILSATTIFVCGAAADQPLELRSS